MTADFGFGPSLDAIKTIAGGCYARDMVAHNLTVRNIRSAGGETVGGGCRYTFWVQQDLSSGNAIWFNTGNLVGAAGPDGAFSYSNWANAADTALVTNFGVLTQSGVISTVEVMAWVYINSSLTDDTVQFAVYSNTAELTRTIYITQLDSYAGAGNQGLLIWRIPTSTLGSLNTWGSYANARIELKTTKYQQKDGAIVYADAVGFRLTSNQPCKTANPDDLMLTVPLTDTFNPAHLQFVSSVPPYSSINTATGVITWNNVRPILPGESGSVRVTFRLSDVATLVTTTNSIGVTGTHFVDGGLANSDYATATCVIQPTGLISGVVWSEGPGAGTGWVGGPTGIGYQPGIDTFIPGVLVELYQCILSSYPAPNPTQDCGSAANNGAWQLVRTQVTDQRGQYLFDPLPRGYYYVVISNTTILGSPSGTADPDDDRDTDPDPCTNGGGGEEPCNDQWKSATNLDTTLVITGRMALINGNFGYSNQAVVYGNIWEDYDGDGKRDTDDVNLDNGTAGITVTLTWIGGISTTQTDANGSYRFIGLTYSGTYTITVNTGTLPAGYPWTNTADPDMNLDSVYTLTVKTGETSGSHDFGYHRTGTFSLGDVVYADWDGDGYQDMGDGGINGLVVYLYNASGAVLSTTTTATGPNGVTGYYTFTNLYTGTYRVEVDTAGLDARWYSYRQTQDPDEAGVCSTCDSRGTAVLSTTQRSLNTIDFGYYPYGFGSIGDTVWRDMNGDGLQSGLAETGIASITVWQEADLNNDGVWMRVMTATTDASGHYLFSSLPDGKYRAVVDTSDSDLPRDVMSNVYVPTTPATTNAKNIVYAYLFQRTYLDADFGFAPLGVIGDFIWQDNNANGDQDAGEPGILGVVVRLYTGGITGTLIATATTDAMGLYTFTNLLSNTYSVVVDTSTLPAGYVQTGDPDATGKCQDGGDAFDDCNSYSTFRLRFGQVDRTRDFGYKPPRAIGDFVWLDSDEDGVQDAGELGLAGVAVVLTIPGDGSVTTTTDIEGYYGFGANVLPVTGTYTVTINTATLPFTMAQTFDKDGTLDHKTLVGVTATTWITDVDFGYRFDGPYMITGTVFYDVKGAGDGLTDMFTSSDGDTPYAGVEVYLWDSNYRLIGTTTTDASGHFTFTHLFNGQYTASVNRNDPRLVDLRLTASPNGAYHYNTVTINNSNVGNQDFGFSLLNVDKSVSPAGAVSAGDRLTYTMVIENYKSATVTGVAISDTIPANTIYVPGSLAITPAAAGSVSGQPSGNLIYINPITINASSQVTITFQVTATAGASVITNTVLMTSTLGVTRTDTVTNPIAVADVTLAKSDNPDPVMAGGVLTYTLVFTNNGPSAAQNVTITEQLPAGVTYGGDVSVPGGMTRASATPPTWVTPTLEVGQSASIVFTVTVGSGVSGTITNTVTITTTTDSNPNNNRDDEPTELLLPGLEVVKDVTPGEVVRQMPFTYTIRITNTGQMTFTTLTLTDTLPPDFYYTPGSGIPDPDIITGDVATGLTLFWNLGSLAPRASINVIFGVTATPGITGTYVNVATATATTPGSVLTRTDDAPVNLQDPRLTLVKQLVSADLDDVAPNYVTFTIAIANVGISVVDVLPMLDQYDTYYLSFVWADVMPDEPADDGILTWYDLTAPPPSGYNGFGYNLAPGKGFHVTTVFSVVHDITSTVNTAVITGATDIHHNPTNRPTDTAPITFTIPTAVELLYFRLDRVSGRQVRLAWATAVEIDNLGFNLYRANVNDPRRASLIHFEPAAVMGGRLGATYVYTDTVPSDGVWWYWLADVDTGGVETHSMQAGIRAEVNAALRYRVYLPVVFKRP